MALQPRESQPLAKATARLNGLTAIDPKLDLGQGVSVVEGAAHVAAATKALADYNQALKTAAALLNEVEGHEKTMSEWSKQVLNGVRFKFGEDSIQYEQAGGIRRSDRKKRTARKVKAEV